MTNITEFTLTDFEKESRLVIEKSRAKARELISAALAESAEIKEKARRDGYAAGVNEGKKAAFQEEKAKLTGEVASARGTILTVAEEIRKHRAAIGDQAVRDMIKLAVAVAEKIVKAEIEVDGNAVLRNVTKAVELAAGKNKGVTILVNEADADAVKRFVPEMLQAFMDAGQIEVAADAAIAKGGCKIVTRECMIDADIASQLDEICAILMGRRGDRGNERKTL